jgi:hypothetical protein
MTESNKRPKHNIAAYLLKSNLNVATSTWSPLSSWRALYGPITTENEHSFITTEKTAGQQ